MIEETTLLDSHSIDVSTIDSGSSSPSNEKRQSTTFCGILRCISPLSVIFSFFTTAVCVSIYRQVMYQTAPIENAEPKSEAFIQNRTAFLQGDFGPKIEAYRYTGFKHQWIPAESNHYTFSEPVPDSFCVKILENGTYRIYSKITLKYTNCFSIYHGLAHYSFDGSASLLDNNNFQWDPPQTGRTPSTLLTIDPVNAVIGDQFCVQTNRRSDIYMNGAVNKMIVTKSG